MTLYDVRSSTGRPIWEWYYNNKSYVDALLLDADGSFRLTTPQYDDLRFPAQAINPVGLAAPPTQDSATGFWKFSKTATNTVAGFAQLPHGWAAETDLSAHIHVWYPTQSVETTGDAIYWQFEYKVLPINGAWDGSTYETPVDCTHTLPTTSHQKHLIHSLTTIDMEGLTAVSICIPWRLSRIGGDASDTYDDVAWLLELDFHYQTDALGSRELTSK